MNKPSYNEQSKDVFRFFTDIATESNIIHLKGKEGGDRIPSRIQMVIVFSLMDVFANYWYDYLGKTKTGHRVRIRDWYDRFCRTEQNKQYQGDKQWKLLSSSRLYDFRNSLVHYMGMSEISEGISMMLAPNHLSHKERDSVTKSLSTKSYRVVAIKPHDFHILVKQGGKLMLNEFTKTVQQAEEDEVKRKEFFAAIERLWDRFQSEGAIKIYNKDILRSQSTPAKPVTLE